jgi:hypothetical protein
MAASNPLLSDNFKTWDVKLIWTVTMPSELFTPPSGFTPETFEIFGVDRGSISISRPLTRISSLERYNQGYQHGVPDIRLTIFTKESGTSFEKLRRLSTTQMPFDVSLVLATDMDTSSEDNAAQGIWIDGYEEYLGCRVTNERTNYTVAEFPVREFECMALRRRLLATEDLELNLLELMEGDGSYSDKINYEAIP